LARCLEERGCDAALLDLDAPLRAQPVTVGRDAVLWQGVDLNAAAAVLVERPVFPWPQPRCAGGLIRDGAPDQARISADRESRSLIASAILAADSRGHVVNPPGAGHLAASPLIALNGLEQAGLAVHPWRLAPAPEDAAARTLLDPAGRDLWHTPERPLPGEMAVEPAPIPGEVLSLLIAGGRPLGGLRFAGADSWLARTAVASLAPDEIPAAATERAVEAVGALGLAFAEVSLLPAGNTFRLLWFDAGADLADWDARSEGRIAPGLADLLIAVASGDREQRP